MSDCTLELGQEQFLVWGCGNGYLSRKFVIGAKVVAVDSSARMIEYIQENIPKYH